ncbi:MAG TPA: hypothetical protein VN201_00905 [Roseateles sp.]|nr:hypothetical protein [Roseateles sp.]
MSDAYSRWVGQSYEDWMNDMATREAPRFIGNARQRRKWLRAYNYGHAVRGERLSSRAGKRAAATMQINRED